MSKVRLTTRNFVDPDLVSNAYVSSEQTAFPVSNLYNAQRRSKVWRSNGYWDLPSSMDRTISFREDAGGPDLIATVAADEYTSSTLFFAAVKAALDAAGDSTYTVDQDPVTLKVRIASDGGGGDGTLRLNWPSAQAMAAVLGFAESYNTGALTYTADTLKIHTSEWIKWDFGISTNPRAFIMIGPRNVPIRISPDAVIRLQGNETDAWSSPTYDELITFDETAMALFGADGLNDEALRYWQAQFIDPSNPNGYIELGSIFLGTYFEPTIGAAVFPFQGQPVDRSTTSFSEGGQTFSDRRQKTERFNIQWEHLTLEEKEAIDEHFNMFGTSDPFFAVFDPNLAFSSLASTYIRYVKYESEPSWSLVTPNNFSYQMTLREEL